MENNGALLPSASTDVLFSSSRFFFCVSLVVYFQSFLALLFTLELNKFKSTDCVVSPLCFFCFFGIVFKCLSSRITFALLLFSSHSPFFFFFCPSLCVLFAGLTRLPSLSPWSNFLLCAGFARSPLSLIDCFDLC